MKREVLEKNFPEQFKEYDQFKDELAKGNDIECSNWATEAIEDSSFHVQSFLLKHIAEKGPFKIQHLMELPMDKREEFEQLVQDMMGHCACFDYFNYSDAEEKK